MLEKLLINLITAQSKRNLDAKFWIQRLLLNKNLKSIKY